MRHGPAHDRSVTGRDFDRELTDEGRRIVQRSADELRSRLPERHPVRVLSSPYARAAQTAEIVAVALGVAWETRDELGAEEPPATLLASECGRAEPSSVLVGHMPTVQALVHTLSGPITLGDTRSGAPSMGFRTGMVVCLDRVDEGWQLVSVFDPHVDISAHSR